MLTFENYINSEERYNKLLTKYQKSKYYGEFRKITFEQLYSHFTNIEEFSPPRLAKIPKDENKFRDIFIYEMKDNLVLKLLNSYLNEYFSHLINSNIFSYKEKHSVHTAIRQFIKNYDCRKTYIKLDLSNYFMTPELDDITSLLKKVGLNRNPYLSLFSNKCYYKKELINIQMGLLPGASISAFLSNAYLNDFDNWATERFNNYIRYSDDMILEVREDDKNIIEILKRIEEQLTKLNLKINPKKVHIFKPYDTIRFLGLEIDNTGIEIGNNKFMVVKRIVKRIAKNIERRNLSKEEKVKLFFRVLNNRLFRPLIKDKENGGILGFWFKGVNKTDRLKQLDYYILDQARFVISGKHNKGALAQGWNTKRLEDLGFHSLTKLFHISKNGDIFLAARAYDILNKNIKYKIISKYKLPEQQAEVSSLFPLILNNIQIKGIGLVEDIIVDLKKNRLLLNGHYILKGEDLVTGNRIWETDKGFLRIKENIENPIFISKNVFLSTVFEASKRNPYFRERIKNTRFVEVPEHKMPYYAITETKKHNVLILNILLFLYKNGICKIDFPEKENSEYYYLKDEYMYFIINKELLNIEY